MILLPPLLTLGAAAPMLILRMPCWRKWAAAIAGVCALITVIGCVLWSEAGHRGEIAVYGARVITPPMAALAVIAFARPLARYFATAQRAD